MNSKFIIIIIYIIKLSKSYTPCPDGSACPSGIKCCDAKKYYTCCRKEFICCYDGLKCCKNNNHFMNVIFHDEIINNSTQSFFIYNYYDQILKGIFDNFKFNQLFIYNFENDKNVKKLFFDFIDIIYLIKDIKDINKFCDICFNEVIKFIEQINYLLNNYCFYISEDIKEKIYNIFQYVNKEGFQNKLFHNLKIKYYEIINQINAFNQMIEIKNFYYAGKVLGNGISNIFNFKKNIIK